MKRTTGTPTHPQPHLADPSPAPDTIPPDVLALLRCPRTRAPLVLSVIDGQTVLTTAQGTDRYAFRDGMAILLPHATPMTPPMTTRAPAGR